jgi:Fic family protein
MSAQIEEERNAYYDILEATQKGDLDITPWLIWFLECLDRAIAGAETIHASVFLKARFWEKHAGESFNERQRKVLGRLLDGGFEGKLTSTKWASLAKTSQDTASRDIDDLLRRNILVKEQGAGAAPAFRRSRSISHFFVGQCPLFVGRATEIRYASRPDGRQRRRPSISF